MMLKEFAFCERPAPNVGLFAIDSGPRQTLEVLTGDSCFAWSSCTEDLTCSPDESMHSAVRGGVVGTSRSEAGAALEAQYRVTARRLGLALATIEDYPGNSQHISGGEVGLLIVESALAEVAVKQRLGSACPVTAVGASLRYDHLRRNTADADIVIPEKGRWLLWVGQPETEAALLSLARVLPHVSRLGMRLLFRAHPRDFGVKRGCYSQLFDRYSGMVHNVSMLSLEAVLALRPCLTLTHFSSLAVELAFRGIPAVHVLFPDAGGATLKALTGYSVPHICEAGGSIAIANEADLASLLPTLIFDAPARARMMRCFDVYFDRNSPQAAKVVSCLKSFFNLHQSNLLEH